LGLQLGLCYLNKVVKQGFCSIRFNEKVINLKFDGIIGCKLTVTFSNETPLFICSHLSGQFSLA